MKEAGFIILGHTNVPEFGLKNITEPELYGPARNPWNPHFSPGGSSGGSAAAVASGMVPVAGASDGGGSIRIPASFTSLTGLKPTRGRTPVGPGRGRQWQGAAIDFVLAKTVRDSAALLDVLQTVEPAAAFQTPLFPGYVKELERSGTKNTGSRFRLNRRSGRLSAAMQNRLSIKRQNGWSRRAILWKKPKTVLTAGG